MNTDEHKCKYWVQNMQKTFNWTFFKFLVGPDMVLIIATVTWDLKLKTWDFLLTWGQLVSTNRGVESEMRDTNHEGADPRKASAHTDFHT